MKKLSPGNPTGIDSFDHTHVMRLEEYHVAVKALDDLTHAMNNAELGGGQAAWVEMVKRMTAVLPYSDSSGHNSMDNGAPADCPWRSRSLAWWPVKVNFTPPDRLECRYHCPMCGHMWRSWYSTAYAGLM